MAFKDLTGDGAWTAANFGGSKPVDADDVGVISTSAAASMPGDEGEIKLGTLHVHENYDQDFGASASPIKIAAAIIKHYGGKPFYFACDHPAAADHVTDDVRIEAVTKGVEVELDSITDGGFSGKYKVIDLMRGTLTLKSDIVFDTGASVTVGYVTNSGSDSKLTIAATAPTLPTLRMNGGKGTTKNAITNVELTNGAELTHSTAAIGTATVGAGCTLNYDHTAVSGDGTVITVEAGGTLNLLNNLVNKTITKVRAKPGSEVLYDPTIHTITTFEDLRSEKKVAA